MRGSLPPIQQLHYNAAAWPAAQVLGAGRPARLPSCNPYQTAAQPAPNPSPAAQVFDAGALAVCAAALRCRAASRGALPHRHLLLRIGGRELA